MAQVGAQREQFLIPIQTSKSSYMSFDEGRSNRVELSPGLATFCASGKVAFISADVVFLILSP